VLKGAAVNAGPAVSRSGKVSGGQEESEGTYGFFNEAAGEVVSCFTLALPCRLYTK
jgi:hypothetical protein